MKKSFAWVVASVIVIFAALAAFTYPGNKTEETKLSMPTSVQVHPISHATAVLNWGENVIYTDPVGDATAFAGQSPATIVLVTDIHGDHFNTSTLENVIDTASLIVPQAVKDLLPPDLAAKAIVLANGQTIIEKGLTVTAIPMYNLPESPDSRHTKGRGNGYVLEKDGFRTYIAGDTAATPEMRALENIDLAFIPMNLPYTMGVDEAASAVLDFKPKQVYPYHYRGPDGLADVVRFKELVTAQNKNIEVVLVNWYPQQ